MSAHINTDMKSFLHNDKLNAASNKQKLILLNINTTWRKNPLGGRKPFIQKACKNSLQQNASDWETFQQCVIKSKTGQCTS